MWNKRRNLSYLSNANSIVCSVFSKTVFFPVYETELSKHLMLQYSRTVVFGGSRVTFKKHY